MAYREMKDLNLAFGWVTDFIKSNGFQRIPEFWAFTIETCGVVSWFLVLGFALAMLVGFSRQMSSFYFLYQYLMGQKLNNPYKPAMLFVLLWVSTHVISFGFSMTMIYFIRYGYVYGILAAIATLCTLGFLAVIGFFVFGIGRKPKPVMQQPQHQPQNPYPYGYPPQQMPPNYHPAYGHIAHQPHQQQYIPPQPMAGGVPHPQTGTDVVVAHDPQFEEAIMILGLGRNFTKAELQEKYHKLVKKVHADKGGTDGLYMKVRQSYEYLLSRFR